MPKNPELTPQEQARMDSGTPPSDQAFDAAAQEAAAVEAESITANIPSGNFSTALLNATAKAINEFGKLIDGPVIEPAFEGGRDIPLPEQIFLGLMAFKTVCDAYLQKMGEDYDSPIGEVMEYGSDSDLALAATEIKKKVKDRDFKKFLAEELPTEPEPEEVVAEPIPEGTSDAIASELDLI